MVWQLVGVADRLFALVMYYWLQGKQASLADLGKGSKLFYFIFFRPEGTDPLSTALPPIASVTWLTSSQPARAH